MRQRSLAIQAGFERYGKKTRREQFLDEMEKAGGPHKLLLLVWEAERMRAEHDASAASHASLA